MEKQINRKQIYDGKVIHVVCDDVSLDNGQTSIREIVIHNGGVCIALKDGDSFYMVRQYRYAFNEELLEFPAGKIEKGEKPDEAILREVVEETGYSAKNVKKLGYMIPTCGYSSEKIYLYYGEADEYVGQNFDFDEDMAIEKYTLSQIKKMIKDGKIVDGKTICLVEKLQLEGIIDE